MSIAVIQFPGSNCENDTMDALHDLEIDGEIIPWNTNQSLANYSGVILPGGFSYQDRIRAGVLASKCSIINQVAALADQGKPILGICNGAQILIESGLLQPDRSLNAIIDYNYTQNQRVNFISDWVFLQPFNAQQSIFLRHFSDSDVLPIQLCHGEGRFLMQHKPTSGFKYSSIDGTQSIDYPVTPNGSTDGIAGITNDAGNILALMPHPERSIHLKRTPFSIQQKAKKEQLRLRSWSDLFLAFKS